MAHWWNIVLRTGASLGYLFYCDLFIFFRVVGFDELGNTDNFPTEVLERRIATSGEKAAVFLPFDLETGFPQALEIMENLENH